MNSGTEDYNQELIIASENGELDAVKKYISAGADVNFMGPNSAALHCAAFNGNEEIVQLLLDNGADPNLADNQRFVPLQLAVSKSKTNICKILIQHGADVTVKTQQDGTLLHLAAAADYYSISDIPEIRQIDINAKDFQGNTAMNVAASLGYDTMMITLRRMDADINMPDNDGISPLMNALVLLNSRKIENWESSGNSGGVMVRYVISNGWMRYIKPYHGDEDELGRDLPCWEQSEITDLSWSPDGLKDYLEAIRVVELLLGHSKINKNGQDNEGNTAFIYACSIAEPEIMQRMIELKFDLTTPNNKGIHPLHYLARSKRLDGLHYYFEAVPEINPNILDANGWTAGHFLADQGGHPEMAKLLIEKGLDVNIESTKEFAVYPKGTRALEVALHWKDEKIADILKSN